MRGRIVSAPILVLFIVGIAAGCATSTLATFQQTGKVVIQLEKTVKKACRDSKAKGWPAPLTLDVCFKASVAYDAAWAGVKTAVKVLQKGEEVDFDTVVLVGKFVVDMVALLREVGVAIPESAVVFVKRDLSTVLVR